MKKLILKKENGFTFIEVISVILIFMLIFTAANSIFYRSVDSWVTVDDSTTLQQSARHGLLKVTELIREYGADEILVVEGGNGLFLGKDGDIEYHIKLLRASETGVLYFESTPIASNISSLNFSLFEISAVGEEINLKEASNDCQWDLLKVELIAGGDYKYKLETLLLPGGNND